jgi:S-adenosylmethionine:tRNA ribosyltransferase-isomerase
MGLHLVNGLLTGLHEPRTMHLAMIEALVGKEYLEVAYPEVRRHLYLWHDFVDLHLLLP